MVHESCCSIQLGSVTFLPPPPLAGHVILSAGKNGLVAVSSPVNGVTTRVIRDHKGAPITTIQCVNEQVSSLYQTKEGSFNRAEHGCTI